jgi:predicted secreted protein
MFRIRRASLAALVAAVAVFPLFASPAAAASPVLFDSIAPGVVSGTEGFGTATVLVPKKGVVTYLVRTDSRLKGTGIQIWTDTGKGWKLATTRPIEADGSVHYAMTITRRTGFWAKYAEVKPVVTSHGRLAGVSADGTTAIRISCADVGPTGSGVKSIVNRTVAISLHGTVRVTVCADASTGFSWGMAALDSAHLMRVGHTMRDGSGPGSPGTETWSVRLTSDGVGRTTLVYSQPWRGGEKAAWTLMLTVVTT